MKDFDLVKAQFRQTVAWLEGTHPLAAAWLRGGPEEKLALHRMGQPEPLRTSSQSMDLIESASRVTTDTAHRLRRWHGGGICLRWIAVDSLTTER